MSEKLDHFYSHEPWITVRKIAIEMRRNENGDVISDYDGRPISPKDTIIVHHQIELTEDNVDDASIALNHENLKVMTLHQHNMIHDRFKNPQTVFVIYGCDISDLHAYVKRINMPGDIMVDVTSLYNCFGTGHDSALTSFVLEMHRDAICRIETRYGKWRRAFVVGGYPRKYERDRLAKRLGAEEVRFIVGDTVTEKESMTVEQIRAYYMKCIKNQAREHVDKWFADMGWGEYVKGVQ